MQASRTEHGDPLENAVAERVNGILKQERLSLYSFENEDEIRKVLIPAIEFYNKERPHASNNWLTPEQAYKQDKGFTNLAMLSGVSEMIARTLVSIYAVPAFGFLAVCFGDATAWMAADLFLIPAFIYVYRKIKK